MRKTRVWITLSCCLLALAVFAWAQATRKPGLWEVTTTMTWQQSPFPGGAPPGAGGPRTTQVCVTQAQIDKFGGPPPQTRGNCQVTNFQKSLNGVSAEMECTGNMTGKGTFAATLIDEDHAKTKVHMSGSFQRGASPTPFEWTMESSAVFKGADCGSVQPIATPGN